MAGNKDHLNTALDAQERARLLLEQMTVAEKSRQLTCLMSMLLLQRRTSDRGCRDDDADHRHRRNGVSSDRGSVPHCQRRQRHSTFSRRAHPAGHSGAVPGRGPQRCRRTPASGLPDADRACIDVESGARRADDRHRPQADGPTWPTACAFSGARHRLRPQVGTRPRNLWRRPTALGGVRRRVRQRPPGRGSHPGCPGHRQALPRLRPGPGRPQRVVV